MPSARGAGYNNKNITKNSQDAMSETFCDLLPTLHAKADEEQCFITNTVV